MDTERIRRIAIEHFGVKDDADRCEEAITQAVNEALEFAARVLDDMPDRERMDSKWNPDPNGMLMEHCPLSCAAKVRALKVGKG